MFHRGVFEPNSFQISKFSTEIGLHNSSRPRTQWLGSQKKQNWIGNLNLYDLIFNLIWKKVENTANICKKTYCYSQFFVQLCSNLVEYHWIPAIPVAEWIMKGMKGILSKVPGCVQSCLPDQFCPIAYVNWHFIIYCCLQLFHIGFAMGTLGSPFPGVPIPGVPFPEVPILQGPHENLIPHSQMIPQNSSTSSHVPRGPRGKKNNYKLCFRKPYNNFYLKDN